jgi:hypothetical protein
MALMRHGSISSASSKVEQVEFDFQQGQDGSAKLTRTYSAPFSVSNIRIIGKAWGTADEDFPGLVCSDVKFTRKDGGLMTGVCTYSGVNDTGSGATAAERDLPVYELETMMSEELIQFHPDFVSKLGGTLANPLNSAIFNADGTFKEFLPASDLAGVSKYPAYRAQWKESRVGKSFPAYQYRQVGKIDRPEGLPGNIELPPPQNWMLVGFSARKEGRVWQISRTWESSGLRGWNKLIYG